MNNVPNRPQGGRKAQLDEVFRAGVVTGLAAALRRVEALAAELRSQIAAHGGEPK